MSSLTASRHLQSLYTIIVYETVNTRQAQPWDEYLSQKCQPTHDKIRPILNRNLPIMEICVHRWGFVALQKPLPCFGTLIMTAHCVFIPSHQTSFFESVLCPPCSSGLRAAIDALAAHPADLFAMLSLFRVHTIACLATSQLGLRAVVDALAVLCNAITQDITQDIRCTHNRTRHLSSVATILI